MLTPVVLAGGNGSRLWPVSRDAHPKQFQNLADTRLSLLQQTLQRARGIAGEATPVIVCHESHRFSAAQQAQQVGVHKPAIILEPVARSTAASIALAALHLLPDAPDAVLLVLPADHLVRDPEALRTAVETALPQAREGALLTFGITPERAETGYGYIRRGDSAGARLWHVDRFVEKPDATTAAAFIAGGDHLWNSGMFLFSARAILAEMERLTPALLATCREAMAEATRDLDFTRVPEASFARCPAVSIDRGIMERTHGAMVVEVDCGWSDIGAWAALWRNGTADADGNVVHGDVLLANVSNSYFHSQGRLVAATGVSDLVVVETADAVLVASRDGAQDVRILVDTLKSLSRREASQHRRVHRPWGTYDCLVESDRFQVKRIVVEPGHGLSLQLHHHRAEHWVVVRGTARVTCGDTVLTLHEDQSTYIPIGVRHSLANPGRIPLEIIEIQTGSYLGEDDIVRFEDAYGRRD